MGIDTVALMSTLMRIGQLLLALSLLVFIHELGHFLFARLFGVRVDKFYLFFDVKGKALWRYRPKGSETEYGTLRCPDFPLSLGDGAEALTRLRQRQADLLPYP